MIEPRVDSRMLPTSPGFTASCRARSSAGRTICIEHRPVFAIADAVEADFDLALRHLVAADPATRKTRAVSSKPQNTGARLTWLIRILCALFFIGLVPLSLELFQSAPPQLQ